MPQCQLLFSAVFGFRNPTWKIFSESHRTKAQYLRSPRTTRRPKGTRRRAPGRPHHPQARAPPGCAWAWWAHLGCPPTSPSRLYIPPIVKTLSTRANFPEKFRRSRHRRTHLGGFWSCLPALCRRGRSSPEASSSPCQPPRWCVSSSSQDYGSIAVARWLSSPICASCLVDLVSCLSWSRSFLCNPYVVFDGIRWILHVVLRLVINTSYFIICYFVILHALRC